MEVKLNDFNENGLFTLQKYKKNDTIYVLTGTILSYPTRESIHVGNNEHIIDEYGIYINHSFMPNINIKNKQLIALRDINVNEELVFNYNETELKMHSPFYVDGKIVCGNIIK